MTLLIFCMKLKFVLNCELLHRELLGPSQLVETCIRWRILGCPLVSRYFPSSPWSVPLLCSCTYGGALAWGIILPSKENIKRKMLPWISCFLRLGTWNPTELVQRFQCARVPITHEAEHRGTNWCFHSLLSEPQWLLLIYTHPQDQPVLLQMVYRWCVSRRWVFIPSWRVFGTFCSVHPYTNTNKWQQRIEWPSSSSRNRLLVRSRIMSVWVLYRHYNVFAFEDLGLNPISGV